MLQKTAGMLLEEGLGGKTLLGIQLLLFMGLEDNPNIPAPYIIDNVDKLVTNRICLSS